MEKCSHVAYQRLEMQPSYDCGSCATSEAAHVMVWLICQGYWNVVEGFRVQRV